jgi:hypothetical protein
MNKLYQIGTLGLLLAGGCKDTSSCDTKYGLVDPVCFLSAPTYAPNDAPTQRLEASSSRVVADVGDLNQRVDEGLKRLFSSFDGNHRTITEPIKTAMQGGNVEAAYRGAGPVVTYRPAGRTDVAAQTNKTLYQTRDDVGELLEGQGFNPGRVALAGGSLALLLGGSLALAVAARREE